MAARKTAKASQKKAKPTKGPKKKAKRATPTPQKGVRSSPKPAKAPGRAFAGDEEEVFDPADFDGECIMSPDPPEISGCRAGEECICGTAMVRN